MAMVHVPDSVERQQKIERLRREIAEGTYETPERFDAAVDEILDRFEDDSLGGDGSADRPKRPK